MADKRRVPKMSKDELRQFYKNKDSFEYYSAYQDIYANSNRWLKFFENTFEQVSADLKNRAALGEKLQNENPDNARAMGAFMCDTIIREFGKNRFVTVVGNPFKFWKLYNKAAKRSQGKSYVLSDRAMKVIELTEAKYQMKRIYGARAEKN